MKRGINLENVKENNRSTILRLLNNDGPMSRSDIAAKVGLTPASVTIICSEFLEEGIIRELGELEEGKRAGRKKILVELNREYKHVFCIGIESEETYLSITDLMENVIVNKIIPTDTEIEPKRFLKMIANHFKDLMWESGLSKDQILGVGVSIPGRVDSESGRSLHTYSIWDTTVEVSDVLQEELGIPVVIENNVKAYAQAELLFGNGREKGNMLLLKWGPGVGSSIIVDHSVFQGASGLAAEIGHMIGRGKQKLCKCGRRGCLQTEISTHAIIASIMEAYGDTEESHSEMPVFDQWIKAGNKATYKNASKWGSLEDAKMQRLIEEKISYLVEATINMVAVLDSSKIVVYGYLFDVPGFYERFKKAYLELDKSKDEAFFAKSEISSKQYHTEALSIVLDRLFY